MQIRPTIHEGTGFPAIFLHNGFDSSRAWDAPLTFLKERFTCIAWDRAGYGTRAMEENPLPEGSIDEGVAELEALVDGLGLNEFHLVGHCMGGSIALRYAARHPRRVVRLALEATGFFSDDRIQMVVDLTRMPWNELSSDFQIRMEDFHGTEGARRLWDRICRHRSSYIMDPQYDIRALLPEVGMPCLVINADRDLYFTVEHAKKGADLMPRAEVWIPKGGHDFHEKEPHLFAERLFEFFGAGG